MKKFDINKIQKNMESFLANRSKQNVTKAIMSFGNDKQIPLNDYNKLVECLIQLHDVINSKNQLVLVKKALSIVQGMQ